MATGNTKPAVDAKPDARLPDTAADKTAAEPAGWQETDDAARLAGFHNIDGHGLPEGSGASAPVQYPAVNVGNSTFADRKAARLKQGDTTVDPAATTEK